MSRRRRLRVAQALVRRGRARPRDARRAARAPQAGRHGGQVRDDAAALQAGRRGRGARAARRSGSRIRVRTRRNTARRCAPRWPRPPTPARPSSCSAFGELPVKERDAAWRARHAALSGRRGALPLRRDEEQEDAAAHAQVGRVRGRAEAGGSGRGARHRRGPRDRGRRRARQGSRQPARQRLHPRPISRSRRRSSPASRSSASKCSSAATWRSSGWARCSRSRRARASRRSSSSSATTAGRRTRSRWCSSARGSPSTPAASRSSPPPRWTR